MAALGDILSIAHVLKRAYELYQGCASAPSEILLARDYIQQMTLCLEGVRSDLINNPRSFVHQHNDMAKARTQALKQHLGFCDRALRRMEKLLGTYLGFKRKHVSLWDKFRWSVEGKKEIAECKSDLVFTTSLMDMFLARVHLSVLWQIESEIETLARRLRGPRFASIFMATLVLTRLRKALITYRRRKGNTKGMRKPHPGPRKPKVVSRTNSGFSSNPKRNDLLKQYASNLANSSSTTPPPPYQPRKPRPRTPSPDFYYLPGGTKSTPRPGPLRRSSSMQRMIGHPSANVTVPKQAAEYYECWKVGVGKLAIGCKTAPEFVPHKRGQAQLKSMAVVFKEANTYDANALSERDARVKAILEKKNETQRAKGGASKGKKWYFVNGRVVKKDGGRTGMVVVQKAMVILVRR